MLKYACFNTQAQAFFPRLFIPALKAQVMNSFCFALDIDQGHSVVNDLVSSLQGRISDARLRLPQVGFAACTSAP